MALSKIVNLTLGSILVWMVSILRGQPNSQEKACMRLDSIKNNDNHSRNLMYVINI